MRTIVLLLMVASIAACGRAALPVPGSDSSENRAGAAGSGSARIACGNGVVDPGEQCDGSRVASSCRAQGFRSGVLRCDRACRFDVTACIGDPQPTAADACPVPAPPIGLPPGCLEDLCACDREALLDCGMNCWLAVACRVATCTNNPSRRECADGCPNSSVAELSLGECYESSRACTR